MKTKNFFKVVAFLASILFFACDPVIIDDDPDNPDKPVSADTLAPEIVFSSYENVSENKATLYAWVKPNAKDTRIIFEHRQVGESNYQKKTLSGKYADADSIKVVTDLFDLKIKTEYQARFIAVNKVGADTSGVIRISTYIVKDYDNNPYHVVKIGNQYWLQENLKTTHYNDGTAIENITENYFWGETEEPAFCWFKNDIANKKNGALYNAYAANKDKKIFIEGFRVATPKDWETLFNYIGGEDKVYKLTDNNNYYWLSYWKKDMHREQNSTGFTAVLNGERIGRRFSSNDFQRIYSTFWGKDDDYNVGPHCISILPDMIVNAYTQFYNWGMGIRLIKDE